MKKAAYVLVAGVLLTALPALGAEPGEAVFKSLGCMGCHKPAGKSKTTPSLVDIASAYAGKKEQLIDYLIGQRGPIIRPERAGMMNSKIQKTAALADADRAALADFILSYKP
jgi:cytochrome c551/c552